MTKDYIWKSAYKDDYIYFNVDNRDRLHGQYTAYQNGFIDDRKDFFIYEEDDKYIMDFFDQGVYLGSLIKDTLEEILITLKLTDDWVFDMVTIDKNYWNYDE